MGMILRSLACKSSPFRDCHEGGGQLFSRVFNTADLTKTQRIKLICTFVFIDESALRGNNGYGT